MKLDMFVWLPGCQTTWDPLAEYHFHFEEEPRYFINTTLVYSGLVYTPPSTRKDIYATVTNAKKNNWATNWLAEGSLMLQMEDETSFSFAVGVSCWLRSSNPARQLPKPKAEPITAQGQNNMRPRCAELIGARVPRLKTRIASCTWALSLFLLLPSAQHQHPIVWMKSTLL